MDEKEELRIRDKNLGHRMVEKNVCRWYQQLQVCYRRAGV